MSVQLKVNLTPAEPKSSSIPESVKQRVKAFQSSTIQHNSKFSSSFNLKSKSNSNLNTNSKSKLKPSGKSHLYLHFIPSLKAASSALLNVGNSRQSALISYKTQPMCTSTTIQAGLTTTPLARSISRRNVDLQEENAGLKREIKKMQKEREEWQNVFERLKTKVQDFSLIITVCRGGGRAFI